jgi:hypothetical protein
MSTLPLLLADDLSEAITSDPLQIWTEIEPPSPLTGLLPPLTPPLGLMPEVSRLLQKGLDPAEVRALREASAVGCLQDVHQILLYYILTQSPHPITGRLLLYSFHEAVSVAITYDYTSILSYLFFMCVGEPSEYFYSAIMKEAASVFEVLLNYGWNINHPLEETKPPALG